MDKRFDYAGSNHQCPLCGAPLLRVHRRLIDRITSLVRPVQRYRCPELDCDWQGNMPIEHAAHEEPLG